MKKLFLVVLSLSMALSACMPEFIRKALNPVPTKNVQATATILYLTRAAETISAANFDAVTHFHAPAYFNRNRDSHPGNSNFYRDGDSFQHRDHGNRIYAN